MAKLCEVCHDSARGIHFGVHVCSACSAFFRRSVAKNQKYKCLQKNVCEIVSTIRNMCRSCRYSKCIAVGMKKDAVQKYRDVYGKREDPPKRDDSALLPSTSSSPPVFRIMDEVVKNYYHLENVRKVIHQDEKQSVFVKHVPRALNYKETIKVFLKEAHLVEDFTTNTFADFAGLADDQKKVLLGNFYLQFLLLEGGHFARINGRTDLTFLPSGDYIDCNNPETYYYDPDGKQPISAEEASKMFASSFGTYRRNVYYPMFRDQVDQFEFLALAALALFDTGLDGQTDECMETCRRVREEIQREMLQYCEIKTKHVDSSIRMGNMLSVLPTLQRATRRFQEDMMLSNVMQAYSVDQKFYELGNIESS